MTTPEDPDREYSTLMVAAMFRVGISTVHRWYQVGWLPGWRTTQGALRFHARDIHRLMEGGEVKS